MGGQLAARDRDHSLRPDVDDMPPAGESGVALSDRQHPQSGEGVTDVFAAEQLWRQPTGGLLEDGFHVLVGH